MIAEFSPEDRRVLLSKIDEELTLGGKTFKLSTNQYWDAIEPTGFQYQKSFSSNPYPVFVYGVPGVRIEKRVFMPRHMNAVVIAYKLTEDPNAKESRGSSGVRRFSANFLATSRDFHWLLKNPKWHFDFKRSGDMVFITPTHEKPPTICIASTLGTIKEPAYSDKLVHDVFYRTEMERGYDCLEDLHIAASLDVDLLAVSKGTNKNNIKESSVKEFFIVCSAGLTKKAAEETCRQILKNPSLIEKQEIDRKNALVDMFYESNRARRSDALTNLVLASDDFIIKDGRRKGVIAGYPWFGEWGRDSFISLPGLCVVTGRKKDAEDILVSLAGSAKDGLIPNMLPGARDPGNYNSIDASLWLFWAVEKYLEHTNDYVFVKKRLWTQMKEIIRRYKGMCTPDGLIQVDSKEPMTWMDAVLNGTPVTLRSGKPVEIQALWYNALALMSRLAIKWGADVREYTKAAELCKKSFNEMFWNPAAGYLYDVVRDDGRDASIRPNALFSVSMPFPVLDKERWRSLADVALRELVTPYGIRTLAASDVNYRGDATGTHSQRDLAYHQGTAWPWLMGAFIDAYSRAHPHKGVKVFTEALVNTCSNGHSVGCINEVFSGSWPHKPEGCISQAWSVGEILRVLAENP